MKIVHASISERGNTGQGAKPGDQTGREVCVREWYSKPWAYVLRYPDRETAAAVSRIAADIARSNLAGYSQQDRNALYRELKKNNYSVSSYIKCGIKTSCDCSSFVYSCYAVMVPVMRRDGNAPTTSTMERDYLAWGFKKLTGDVYTKSPKLLLAGDVLVAPGKHTAMAYDPEGATEQDPDVDHALDVLAMDVIHGHWGTGHEVRMRRIYDAIRQRVNEIL